MKYRSNEKNALKQIVLTAAATLLGLALTLGQAFAKDKVTVFAAASLTNALLKSVSNTIKLTILMYFLLHLLLLGASNRSGGSC